MRQRKRRKTMLPEYSNTENAQSINAMPDICCVNGAYAARRCQLPTPSALNNQDCASQLKCDASGLTIEYDVLDRDDKEAAAIRADVPVPRSGIGLYYFEITVVNAGVTGRVGVGLCEKNVKLDKMPGWEKGSYGYHGDDGCTFQENSQSGERYGPKYGAGDVIGCCWDFIDDLVFFTMNGRPLAKAFSGLTGNLYPTIGIQTKGGRVTVNFGSSPYTFDIESHAQAQRERALGAVLRSPLEDQENVLAETVLGYLVHAGYARAAEAFARDSGFDLSSIGASGSLGNVVPSRMSTDALNALRASRGSETVESTSRNEMLSFKGIHERQSLVVKIMEGHASEALAMALRQFPDLNLSDPETDFLLQTQLFIEMVMSGDSSLEDAIRFGRAKLLRFYDTFPSQLEEVFCLLAYKEPVNSPVGHLVTQTRRDLVADKLNQAILESQRLPRRSALDLMIAQCKVVLDAHSDCGNGPAALLKVDHFL